MVNQLVSAGTIDNMFSLCFGMVEGEGALLLGDAPLPANISLVYTPQVIKPSHPFYYNAKLQALAVDGNALAVDAVRGTLLGLRRVGSASARAWCPSSSGVAAVASWGTHAG